MGGVNRHDQFLVIMKESVLILLLLESKDRAKSYRNTELFLPSTKKKPRKGLIDEQIYRKGIFLINT